MLYVNTKKTIQPLQRLLERLLVANSDNLRLLVKVSNPGIAIGDACVLAQLLHGHLAGIKPAVAVSKLISATAATQVEPQSPLRAALP